MASLLDILAIENQGVIEHSELATFLQLLQKGFNNDMKSTITSLFDVPQTYKTNFITKDNKILKYPIFSIATASTLAWLKKNIKKEDSLSGFSARFIYAVQTKKTKVVPIPIPPDKEMIKSLYDVFKKIQQLKPEEIILDKEFKKVYTDFYIESEKLIDELPFDDGLKSIYSRLQTDYFLKFTILECVLTGKKIASRGEAVRALYLVAFYMAQATVTIQSISHSEEVILENKILKYIREQGPVTRTDIHRFFKNNLSAKKLNTILSTLIKAEQIISEKSKERNNANVFRLNS